MAADTQQSKQEDATKPIQDNSNCDKTLLKVDTRPGLSVSGRTWKKQKKRATTMVAVKEVHKTWEMRTKERQQRASLNKIRTELKTADAEEKEKERRRSEQRKKQRIENAKKSQSVQLVTNPLKIKKLMKRRQTAKLYAVP